ncbi:hypothetical protein VNO80_10746 [Phaseolus coccineus]|uniref:Uncharacterized protein n=1 Tax=Phaseolus coccineus TaxID=3886 RepID=A0AAN9RE45_PHACN
MEKAEQEALYSSIQGFVGNSWNGLDLYPDPCGWTPIQRIDSVVEQRRKEFLWNSRWRMGFVENRFPSGGKEEGLSYVLKY